MHVTRLYNVRNVTPTIYAWHTISNAERMPQSDSHDPLRITVHE
jgi:hypothetical protein